MKKQIILILSVVVIATFSQLSAQEQSVPEKVKSAFSEKFPDAKKVKWDQENKTEWEAEFKMDGKEYSANFATDGTWKETEHEIAKSEIPAEVSNTINKELEGYKIEEAEISETADGLLYEFELEKGEINVEVAISADGKIVKKELKMEDDDEDND